MASQLRISQSCLTFSEPFRLVFMIAPGILVRIGPDLDTALSELISKLVTAFNERGNKVRYIVTTYCLVNITIMIECCALDEEIDVQLLRLHLQSGEITAIVYKDLKLSRRIAGQLKGIREYQPKLAIPFRCVEDWPGYGPKDHPIYEMLVKASASKEDWQEFKDAMRSRPVETEKRKKSIEASCVDESLGVLSHKTAET